jgi:hypothetical protein
MDATGIARDEVIYGDDDRVEMFELAPGEPTFEIGTSAVAAMVKHAAVKEQGEEVWLDGPAWGDEQGLCADVRFGAQPVAAACTAVAVTGDLVLTAGHCARLCSQTRFVFGWWYDGPGQLRRLTDDDIYDCVDVVVDEVDDTDVDYAWLRLDRPRAAGPTVTLRLDAPAPDEHVALVSFPSGIPMKGDRGGRVTATGDRVFTASLDAFGGSSGGPVLDDDGAVLGVLGGGAADLTLTEEGCVVPTVLSHGGMERATTSSVALDGLCAAEPASSLCDGDGGDATRPTIAGCHFGPDVEPFGGSWTAWLGLGAILVTRRRREGWRG